MVENETLSTELLITVGAAILLLSFIAILLVYLNQRKLTKRRLENQKILDLLQRQEMRTMYALLESQDSERKRISTELQDTLGSILVTLTMYADSLTDKRDLEQISDITSRISNTSEKASQKAREISNRLDSGLLKQFGLKTAITQLMDAIQSSGRIETNLVIQFACALSNELGLEIYRIIQEMIHCSMKHSRCSQINLDIQTNGDVSIIYEDNGIGLSHLQKESDTKFDRIQKRVKKLCGVLKIDSTPKNGTTFIIELPTH